jgi:hypothetical protein
MDKAATQSDSESLCAIIGAELAENMLQVNLYRLFSDEELVCDVAVAISLRQVPKNFYFPTAKRLVTVVFGQLGCDLGSNALLPRINPGEWRRPVRLEA